jgi:hypothetical protein
LAERRFPPPWSVEELDACFIVKDSGGQKLVLELLQSITDQGCRYSTSKARRHA